MQKVDLQKGVKALQAGSIIVYPTDTLYALGAYVYHEEAVKKIFEVKQRPFTEALPVAVASLEEMEKIAEVTEVTRTVVQHFLPGALTVVVNRKPGVLDVLSGGRDTIAVRIPKSLVALELLTQVGPLTVTSANIHSEQPAYDIAGIQQHLPTDKIAAFLDVGRLEGKPSTIVDLTGEKPQILRKGVISEKEIVDAIAHG